MAVACSQMSGSPTYLPPGPDSDSRYRPARCPGRVGLPDHRQRGAGLPRPGPGCRRCARRSAGSRAPWSGRRAPRTARPGTCRRARPGAAAAHGSWRAGPVDQRVVRAQAGPEHDLLPSELHRRRKILCSTKHVNDSEHHPQPTAVFSNLLAYTEDRSVVLQVCSS